MAEYTIFPTSCEAASPTPFFGAERTRHCEIVRQFYILLRFKLCSSPIDFNVAINCKWYHKYLVFKQSLGVFVTCVSLLITVTNKIFPTPILNTYIMATVTLSTFEYSDQVPTNQPKMFLLAKRGRACYEPKAKSYQGQHWKFFWFSLKNQAWSEKWTFKVQITILYCHVRKREYSNSQQCEQWKM